MNCDTCQLPTSGQALYACPQKDWDMTPHWCRLYRTRPRYRAHWDANGGPGQVEGKPRPRRTKLLGGCGRDGEFYDPKTQAFCLALCRECTDYDAAHDLCLFGAEDPKRCGLLSIPCAVRVTQRKGVCPKWKW